VPVLIVDPQSGDPDSEAAQIDRLVTQHVENTHRAGLTTTDEIEVAKQLTAFGLTPGQIARRTRTKDDRAEIAAYDQATAKLAEQGMTVVPRPEWDNPKVRDIRHLRNGDDRVSAETHADCPGRAAYIEVWRHWDDNQFTASVVDGCIDYQAHRHTASSDEWSTTSSGKKKPVAEMTDDERGQARQQRRLVIDHNKASKSATDVRRAWTREFLARKTAPKGTRPVRRHAARELPAPATGPRCQPARCRPPPPRVGRVRPL
jgi:hypothetical protein